MERRVFLEKSGKFSLLAMIFGLISPGLKGFLNLEKEEKSVSFEELPFPDIERAPELLKNYFKSFPEEKRNWLSIIEDQKNRVLAFINFDIYKENLKKILKEVYNTLSEEEINLAVLMIIGKRNNDLKELKPIMYNESFDSFGYYYPKSHLISYDTTGMGGDDVPEGDALPQIELAAVPHELWHAFQREKSKSGFLYCVLKKILDLYDKKGLLENFENNSLKIKTVSDNNFFVDYDNFEKIFPNADFFQIPIELVSFSHSIKQTLSLVCEFNKDLGISFDLNKDQFTQEHLDFLKQNHSKIFQKRTDKNIFERLQSFFTDDEIIELMNYNV